MSDVTVVTGFQGPSGPPMPAVRLATAAPLPAYTASDIGLTFDANGLLTIDGEDVIENTEVIVKDEGGGTSIYNRIYTVSVPGDGDTAAVLLFKHNVAYKVGFPVVVGLGTANEGTLWRVTTDGTIVPGTTAITWTEISTGGGGGGSDDQTAAEVPFTANGDIAATNVQTAIVEVRDDTDTKLATKPSLASTAPADVTKDTAAVGSSTTAARSDHKHNISTAAAGALTLAGSSSEGSATSLARSDHNHALPATAAAGTAAPGDSAAEGSATSLARSDHRHELAAFGSTSGTFAQGNDSRFSDDRTASGLRSATTVVSVSAATAPTVGQVLMAVNGTTATWQTAVGGSPFVVDDATTNDVTDVVAVRHTTSGTAANNIASGILLQTEDSAGNVQDTARVAGILLNATSGSETSAIDFWAWSAGALARRMRLGSDGGLLVGMTTALGGVGIGVPKDTPLYGGNGAGTAYSPMIQMVAGVQVQVGGSGTSTQIQGNPINWFSYGVSSFTISGVQNGSWSNGAMQWGANDATTTPSNFTHRGSNGTGTNIAGAVLTVRAPLGTGTGAVGTFRVEGGQLQASGTTAHSTVTLAEFKDSDTDDTTAFLVRTRKGGVEAVELVTLGAADSGGTGLRALCVPN